MQQNWTGMKKILMIFNEYNLKDELKCVIENKIMYNLTKQ